MAEKPKVTIVGEWERVDELADLYRMAGEGTLIDIVVIGTYTVPEGKKMFAFVNETGTHYCYLQDV